MPIYLFKNPENGEILEVYQKMDEEHFYTDRDGIRWDRVFLSPNTSIDTKIDENSPSDFVRKTAKKGMTIGDMWDESAKLSEKRRKSQGKDPIKEKAIKKYEDKTKKRHPFKND